MSEVFLDIDILSGLFWVSILFWLLCPRCILDTFGRWEKQSVSMGQWVTPSNGNGDGQSRTEPGDPRTEPRD